MKNYMNYAPPIDIPSFQLFVTEGCSHNSCSFCTMFNGIPFRAVPMEEIENDLMNASKYAKNIESIVVVT